MSATGAARSPHRVRRLALAVQGLENADAALAWQRALHEGIDGSWRPMLDAALDAAAARAGVGDRTWRVPRLQLRLRARDPQALTEAVRAALDDALIRRALPAAQAPTLQSAAERAAMVFEVYLATGRVPWHDDEADAAALAHALRAAAAGALDRALAAAAWPGAWAQRAGEGAASPVLRRWAALLDEPAVERLRAAWAAAGAAVRTTERSAPAPNGSEAARWLWQLWHRTVSATRGVEGGAAARPVADGRDGARAGAPRARPTTALPRAADRPAVRRQMPGTALHRAAATGDEKASGADADADAAAATWWAHDAGLVLLHPYLPTLLRATGCAVDDAPIPDRLPRAAALLHALATGRDEAFEFELTLAKLLLGLAPDAPLPPGALAIDAAARAEVDALLDAAIGHWPALGGTGIDAFRASFLAREGTLSRCDDGWHLRVVEEPFDVLLGRLPWGIGRAHLPWMDAPLHVHWGAWGA